MPPGGAVSYGIDVGGTKILGVALGADGKALAEHELATPQSAIVPAIAPPHDEAGEQPPGDAAEQVADAIAAVARRVGWSFGPVGVGMPGMVDSTGVVRFSPNLPGAHGVDMQALVAARLPGAGVVVANDADCGATAELRVGAARGVLEGLVVTLGTGIGGSVISSGKVQRGAHGFAGEVGHMVVEHAGPMCACGRRGCWERYASGGGLGRLAREAALAGTLHKVVEMAGGDPELVRGEHVSLAAAGGDEGALRVMEELGWWVAMGLANLVAVLDPELIVVGGGLAEVGELVLAPARRSLASLVEGGRARPDIPIVPAQLGRRAGAVGAALLVHPAWG